MTQGEPQDRIHALPIWLLVLGALMAGSGGWCLLALPPMREAAAVLFVSAAILFVAGAMTLQKASRADAGESE